MLGMNQGQLELLLEYIELQKVTDEVSEKRKQEIKTKLIVEAKANEEKLSKIRENLKNLGK